tara:strand:- start:1064 stop:1702 length:639 start_codon:yes stop_codon:yes gene_type:complete
MIVAKIIGSDGQVLKVNGEGEVAVVIHQHPPINEEVTALPFRQYFTDNGGLTGSNDMTVNGTLVAPQDFYITANPIYDIYIKYITVEIGDGGSPALNKFGALTSLTNGVAFLWDTQTEPNYELHEGIKTNKEFIRIASDTGAIGTGTEAYLADVSGGGTEKSYLPNMDMKEIYGLPWGLRLRGGTLDKIIFRVQDNLSGLSTFNAIATGTRI